MDQTNILILFGIILWLVGLTYYINNIALHYKKLIGGAKKEDLVKILDQIVEDLTTNKKDISDIKDKLTLIGEESKFYVQKVGILRFNPFSDTGGDQSFILSILNGKDTGIVLSSLHSRGITRWYAKNVHEGKGVDYDLSDEEKQSIKNAVLLHKKK